MKRVYLLVEGQTEETFVRELLAPYYQAKQIYLTPIIVSTRQGYRGGLTSYSRIRPQIERLCKQDAQAIVTTLFDLYALPPDFPGKHTENWLQLRSGLDKAIFVEAALAQDIPQPNFLPYIQVHEFEALLFTYIDAFKPWTDDDSVLIPLRKVRSNTAPEDINDNPDTAPSKRIESAVPGYQKPFHGPLIACDIGLDPIRAACPHFAEWLSKLDMLG